MDETVRVMKKQLFWSRLTGILFAIITILLIVSMIVFGGYLRRAADMMDRAEMISQQLEAAAMNMENVDWETVGKNLETISDDLSAVDWLGLTDDIGKMATEAENSLQIAQKAITDLDIETLNEAITELRDVIKPLANFVNRVS